MSSRSTASGPAARRQLRPPRRRGSGRGARVLLLACLLLTAVRAFAADGEKDRLGWFRVRLEVVRFDLPRLAAEGLDIAGVDREARTADLFVSAADAARLESLGWDVELVRWLGTAGLEADTLYLDVDELNALVDGLVAARPDLVRVLELATTENGRPYRAVKISDNVMVDEDEPAVLFDFGHHAREIMMAELAADLMEYLVMRYDTDPQVASWVDRTEIWIIPNQNPDGLDHVFGVDPGWRKNRRNNGNGSFGVDLNRNYDADWGICGGSSGSGSSELYRGPFAESEPETAALADLAREQRPVFNITFHSYGELVLYPYGCSGVIPPDQEASEVVGHHLARTLIRDVAVGTFAAGYSWSLLNVVDGDSKSWFYAEPGALAYTVEVNSSYSGGFSPNYNTWRDSTVQRSRPGWQYILDRLDGPSVRGHVTDACSGIPLPATVAIDEIPLGTREAARTAEPLYGRYQRILLHGDYHLRVSHPGYHQQVQPLSIRQAALDRDVSLVPLGAGGLVATGWTVDDGEGDGDGRLDPGETARLRVDLRAVGEARTGISAILTTSDPFLTVIDPAASYPDLAAGAEGMPVGDAFQVAADPATPPDHEGVLSIVFIANEALCAPAGEIRVPVTPRRSLCPAFLEPLDSDPGWTIVNSKPDGWEFGPPTALALGRAPGSAATGANVLATNREGLYPTSGTFALTTSPYDLTGLTGVTLGMQRWLSSEQGFDYATLEASENGSPPWHLLWTGTSADRGWTAEELDASVVDGAPAARFRFTFTSDPAAVDGGWYLDDVAVCGEIAPALTPVALVVADDTANPACSDGDGFADGGEIVTLRLTVENRGVAAALGASVGLASGGASVEVLTPTGALGNVPAGGQAEVDFLARVDLDAACGEEVSMATAFRSNGGLPFSGTPISLPLEMDGAACDANACLAACGPTTELIGLALSADGTLAWIQSTDPCHAAAGIAYRVYRGTSAAPLVSPPAAFPSDTTFTDASLEDRDGSLLDPGFDDGLQPALGTAFLYLVADVGTDGRPGPLGHYAN